ncbi:DUF6020 family protein [Limosilactobacillus mucosae]|uniref:DUF6020 family protein n=1 Tax=Limosilactobacillus mucosae TaxID=97478 RepID=UPI00087FF4DE|nr:DUF6020 family protein [Limosilactobacillus mucosae]SDN73454.1 hypothetical protein SAMN05216430_1142 [Limosilactobacillus mucosae]SEL22098.1 hypothetical protein SAMN05216545_1122 [Limosilactobacillus mucosae]SFK34686.1 hypothetical protein SAMN05216461_1143 [Limosilactobacillus mucosae]
MSKAKSQFLNIVWLFIGTGMLVSYPTPLSSNNRLLSTNSYTVIMVALWLAVIYYLSRKWIIKITKLDVMGGVILSFLYNFTFMISAGLDDSNRGLTLVGTYYLNHSLLDCMFSIFAMLSWAFVLTYTIAALRTYCISKLQLKETYSSPHLFKIFGCMMLIWSFTIITYYPGQISWDALRQFCEFEGRHLAYLNFTYTPTNHQPWFVTLIFGSLFKIGQKLVNTNFGVFTVVLFQTIITGIIYSIATSVVWKKVGKLGGIHTFILFASPVFSTYAITIDKSTIYYALCVAYYLVFLKLLDSVKQGVNSSYEYLLYLIISFFFSEFRNDSKYIVIITTTVLIGYALVQHQKVRYLIATTVTLLILLFGWNSYLNYKKVIPSATSEALTLPARQISYIYLNDKGSLSKQEINTINKVTPVKELRANYDVNSGDNLKNLFPMNTFLNGKSIINDVVNHKITLRTTQTQKKELEKYLKLWITLGFKHPIKYIEVYLAANSKYFNPFFGLQGEYNLLFLNYYPNYGDFLLPTWYSKYSPLFSSKIRNNVQTIFEAILAIPFISIIINVGFPLWWMIVLLSVVLSITNKEKNRILISLIPFVLMVTLYTVTPINGYSRYVISTTAVLPLITAYILENIHHRLE